jgi:hypothetical protein
MSEHATLLSMHNTWDLGLISDDFSLKNSQKECRGKKDKRARCKKSHNAGDS